MRRLRTLIVCLPPRTRVGTAAAVLTQFRRGLWALTLAAAFCLPLKSAQAQLDENCVVSILNRTAQVKPDGSWVVSNAPSTIGQVRARATCSMDGMTVSGQSEYFDLTTNGGMDVPQIALGAQDAVPSSLELSIPFAAFSAVGEQIQLGVTATYPDGSTSDVTDTAAGTNYSTSNDLVVSVDDGGLATAISSGTVLLSAMNEGALAITTMFVTLTDDSDGDGIADDVELANGLDPNNPVDGMEDLDGDGLTNKQELVDIGTRHDVADTDGDGIDDGEEVQAGADGYVTNPLLADSDGDGVSDGLEVATGSDPTDPTSLNLGAVLVSIEFVPTVFSLTFNDLLGDASIPLNLVGRLTDGDTIDLTSTSTGTSYQSSDLSICNFGGDDGRVFAGMAGTCTITGSNTGFNAESMGTVENFSPIGLSFVSIPGTANNVDINGPYAYVAASTGLHVVSVSDRNAPVIVGSATPGVAWDVKIAGDRAYVAAAEAGLVIYSITDPANPALLGMVELPSDALDLAVRGNQVLVAGGSGGLHVVDAIDPTAPALVGSAATSTPAKGVAYAANGIYAVTAGGSGGTVVDLTDPANPSEVASYGGAAGAQDLVVTGNTMVVASANSSLVTYDISNPLTPTFLANTDFGTGGRLNDVTVVAGIAAGADVFFVNEIPLVNITDPSAPSGLGTIDLSNFRDDNGSGIAADSNYVYLTANTSNGRLYIGQFIQLEDNAGIPPEVEIVSASGSPELIVGETATVQVEATDDVVVAVVDLFLNGEYDSSDTSAPYQFSAVVPSNIGTLQFQARATDLGGASNFSSLVTRDVIPDPLTTVIGVVADEGGVIEGAVVRLTQANSSVEMLTNTMGEFSFEDVSTIYGPYRIVAEFSDLRGVSVATAPNRGGITDVGTIALVSMSFDGLLAYYPFNGSADDESGNHRHGIVIGATLVADRNGSPASAYSFHGSSWIRAGADGLPAGERTVAFWFSANVIPASRPFPVPFSYGGGSCGTSWFQELKLTSLNVHRHCGVSPALCSVAAVPVGQWTHWATTTSAEGTKTYVNGVEVCSSSTFINNTNVAGRLLSIGVSVTPCGTGPHTDINITFFNGLIDEVVVYDRVLTPDELSVLAVP